MAPKTTPKNTVLITGCSDGGMGAALALEFRRKNFHVYATARSVSKMATLKDIPDIELLHLDVTDPQSLAACAAKLSSLDILINNAGAVYTMPITDLDLDEARKLFDLNLWGPIATIQAFLPLLQKSTYPGGAIIANHTSVGAGLSLPFQATYNASKAALVRLSDTLRLELQPFNIRVVDLRTASVSTNVIKNVQARQPQLPANSIYQPAREVVESSLRGEWVEARGGTISAEQWAREVVGDLLKRNPPLVLWRGGGAWMMWMVGFVDASWLDGMVRGMVGLDKVAEAVKGEGKS